MPHVRLARFALSLLLALPACGGGGSDEPDGGVGVDAGLDSGLDPDGCRILTLGEPEFQLNLFQQVTGLRYPVEPNLEGEAGDVLLVELYDSTTGDGLPPLTAGTYDLGAAPNDDLNTCQHCVWLITDDQQPGGALDPIYFQSQGTLTLDQVTDPLEPVFTGSTSRVVLRRARYTAEGEFLFEPEGDCVSISGVAFDTSPTPGQACLSAEDCGNPMLEICDPDTLVCAEPQCGDFNWCADGEMCVSQYLELFNGACYRTCNPGATSSMCEDGQVCVQYGVDPRSGICKHIGDGPLGSTCEVEDTSTSCTFGEVCSAVSGTCTPSCGFFEADTGCPDASLCSLFGVCEPESSGGDNALGSACDAEAELASACGPDGEAFRGICFSYDASLVCEKACLSKMAPWIPDDLGCLGGEFCAMRFTSGVGICLPLPVCGDGELGEIIEICDDGNTDGNDGCSADCLTVEYDVLCAAPPALALDDSAVAGNTATGKDGFLAGCQGGIARAELYTVSPPGPGRLRLRLVSATAQVVSLRTDCADAGSELGCGWLPMDGDKELVLQVTDASPAPMTAIVSALTVLEQGPYTVSAEFVPELCGDGIVAGNEICDDGNTGSNDGCRGDCRLIEYDYYCTSSPLLSTTAPQTGDTTGAINLFENSCSSSDGLGPDRVYRYVAPAAGNLHLRLDQDPYNLTLVVYDGCGTPDQVTELDCSAVYGFEEADVAVTSGQVLTVVVEGFPQGGAYTLEATFTPSP